MATIVEELTNLLSGVTVPALGCKPLPLQSEQSQLMAETRRAYPPLRLSLLAERATTSVLCLLADSFRNWPQVNVFCRFSRTLPISVPPDLDLVFCVTTIQCVGLPISVKADADVAKRYSPWQEMSFIPQPTGDWVAAPTNACASVTVNSSAFRGQKSCYGEASSTT